MKYSRDKKNVQKRWKTEYRRKKVTSNRLRSVCVRACARDGDETICDVLQGIFQYMN